MEILLNGTPLQTECRKLNELREDRFPDIGETVTIINGFQTGEDSELKPGDEIFFIPKGKLPPREQLEAMMAARHTPSVHRRVKEGRVAVAGLGGLGSSIAVMLARLGVGELLLVDFDVVEPSNLNRQSYGVKHLGMKKTEAMKLQIEDINPFITVKTADIRISRENVSELFTGYAILCEALDDPVSKAMLINTALEELRETKIVSASGMAGFDSANTITTKHVFSRLYVCGDMESEARPGCGLMAPRVQICAGHQANTVLRLLMGLEEA